MYVVGNRLIPWSRCIMHPVLTVKMIFCCRILIIGMPPLLSVIIIFVCGILQVLIVRIFGPSIKTIIISDKYKNIPTNFIVGKKKICF